MKLAITGIKNSFINRMMNKGYPSFWLINTAGWAILIFIDSFLVTPMVVLQSWNFFLNNTLQWISGYFLTIGLRAIYRKYKYREKSLLRVLGFILFYSFIFSFFFYVTVHVIFLLDSSNFDKFFTTIISYQFIAQRMASVIFPLMTSWSLLYFGIKFWMDWTQEKDRAEKASLLAQSAQLQMLRYQVNPHFLFNSFSSLRALIRSDSTRAEEMVTLLSEFYRYTLATRNNSEVPLQEEIDAIVHYFNIEKIRFGDKIDFSVNIEPLAEEYPIPSFLLHPLVENAIKYGMKTSELPLKIGIEADVADNVLIISVTNSGKWYKHDKNVNVASTGTGLSNIKSRLEYSFPKNHDLEIIKENKSVKVIIKLHKEL